MTFARRTIRPGLALVVAGALAGCNASPNPASVAAAPAPAPRTTAAPGNYATERFTPGNFRLPDGAGCSGDVSRFQAVMDNDWRSGNVNPAVYRQIQGEIAEAASACSVGRDAQASAMIRASKSRHGYPG